MDAASPNAAMISVGELFGGVERHLLGMCEWFRRQNKEPLLILFHDNELASQARKLGFKPLILSSRNSFDMTTPRELAGVLKKNRINLVHAHGYRAVFNSALARRHHDFAFVRTVHGLVEPVKPLSLPWFKSYAYNWLEKTASTHTAATVCYVTEDLRQRRMQDDGGRITMTVHNGIDPVSESSFERPDDLEKGVFNFAAVGRVSPVKGLEIALLALKELDPALKVVLNIIGTGPSLEPLQAQVSELQLGQRVRFLGFKKNVYDYLAHVDALIMPSRHEGLPYTVLETMSLGTPIIASDVGGMGEVLENGATALLVDPGDVAGWAGAMEKLATDPAKAEALALNGKKLQADNYTLDTMGESYWHVYCEKLEQFLNDD